MFMGMATIMAMVMVMTMAMIVVMFFAPFSRQQFTQLDTLTIHQRDRLSLIHMALKHLG